ATLKPYAPIRYLHSLPTRRSSDLAGGSPPSAEKRPPPRDECGGPGSPGPPPFLEPLDTEPRDRRASRHESPAAALRAPAGGAAQDRKSTRLNSSHEWTSYAVFCLK